jgi:hypothetical protein
MVEPVPYSAVENSIVLLVMAQLNVTPRSQVNPLESNHMVRRFVIVMTGRNVLLKD